MHRRPLAGALAITATASLALLASSAGAWDELPCGPTEATAHVCAPGEVARNGTIPVPLPAPVAVAPLAVAPVQAPAQGDTPTPPLVVVPASTPKVTPAQKPRKVGCVEFVDHHPTAPRNARLRHGCNVPKRFRRTPHPPIVLGEYRATQAPSPASLVASLLSQVPALAQDTPFASSIRQGAGGRSSSGGVSATERGRLVPLGIPGHPWTSRSTAPHRGVATSVTFKSGRLTVFVTYSASRGQSSTTVSAR